MSKTTTRTTGQKRKHEEIAAASPSQPSPSPSAATAAAALTMAQMSMNGVQRQWEQPTHFDPAAYQNALYAAQQHGYASNPQMMYAMQQGYAQQAQAMAAAMANGTIPQGMGNPPSTSAQPNGAMMNPSASTPGASGSARGEDAVDRTSYNQLKDAMTIGGVSLREEESLNRARRIPNTYTGSDRTLVQDFIPSQLLIEIFRTVAKHHKLKGLTAEVVTLCGLAVQERLRGLIERANAASLHAWETGAGGQLREHIEDGEDTTTVSMYADGKTPMFDRNLRRDVGRQLLAIEKVEKAEEMRIRRERKEKQEQNKQTGAAAANTGDVDDDEGGPPKKKKKKADGPGVQAKNMSEETKKKLSNNIANAAAGFADRYKWMSAPGTRPTPRAGGGGAAGGAGVLGSSGWGASGARTRGRGGKAATKERSLSMRDVLFVVERERGHGAGRGSARGWS